ncbi:unnamed protein product [Coregonus sp. 'balchen']|nr:unnamed protein product [Coregonus sp. 'balchen']
MATYTVTLNGSAPWGFRLQGGKDFNMPLTVSRTTPGSKAAGGSLVETSCPCSHGNTQNGLPHEGDHVKKEVEEKDEVEVKKFGRLLSKKPVEPTPAPRTPSPLLPPSSAAAVSLSNQKGQYNSPISLYSAHTLREMALLQGKVAGDGAGAARLGGEGADSGVPFLGQEYVPSFNPIALKDSALSTHKPIEVRGPGGKATIVHAQYNTPISMYSQDAIMDAIAGQSQSKGHEGASPVYQAVIQPHDRDEEMAEWARRAANLQSKSFKMLAHLTGTEYMQDPDEEALQRSRDKFESEVKGPRFRKLKNWHNGLSAQILNVPETPF